MSRPSRAQSNQPDGFVACLVVLVVALVVRGVHAHPRTIAPALDGNDRAVAEDPSHLAPWAQCGDRRPLLDSRPWPGQCLHVRPPFPIRSCKGNCGVWGDLAPRMQRAVPRYRWARGDGVGRLRAGAGAGTGPTTDCIGAATLLRHPRAPTLRIRVGRGKGRDPPPLAKERAFSRLLLMKPIWRREGGASTWPPSSRGFR